MNENLIHSDPAIMMGKPVIKGTRISVEMIMEKISSGETIEQILTSYPHLTREGILAALQYATKILKMDETHPTPRQAA